MSRKKMASMSFEERRNLAMQVNKLRREAGMTQAELAELTGMTRQAVSNIERGSVPQAENLNRIFEVFGIALDLEPVNFTPDTSQWLAIIGGIIDSLPIERRAAAGQAAVTAVTDVLVETSNIVSLEKRRAQNVSGEEETDLSKIELDEMKYPASEMEDSGDMD